ncbi:RNA pyrophosphohydrolase [Marinivivus vitaminiproducens]|nr:RNA pyrophosphohydrolase [Geminicoccaceae bacterium SCSIO 64248]
MTGSTEPPTGYRRGVGLVLTDGRGRIFAGERLDTPGAWQMPQGGIDRGEEPRVAAVRELFEEIGTDRATILTESPLWYRYDFPEELGRRLWGGRYRGQAQKWFLLRFDGKDADIDIAGHHPEFSRWTWLPPADLLDAIVAFKRPVYETVLALFADQLPLACCDTPP